MWLKRTVGFMEGLRENIVCFELWLLHYGIIGGGFGECEGRQGAFIPDDVEQAAELTDKLDVVCYR